MATDLYQRCEHCDGSGRVLNPKSPPAALTCPGCAGTGWWKTGLTVGQVERIRGDRELLAVAVEELVRLQAHYALLLNGYDAGERVAFAGAQAWIDRLVETGKLSAAARGIIVRSAR